MTGGVCSQHGAYFGRDCPVCEGDYDYWRAADAAKRAMWRERYRAHIGCRNFDCIVARCPHAYVDGDGFGCADVFADCFGTRRTEGEK